MELRAGCPLSTGLQIASWRACLLSCEMELIEQARWQEVLMEAVAFDGFCWSGIAFHTEHASAWKHCSVSRRSNKLGLKAAQALCKAARPKQSALEDHVLLNRRARPRAAVQALSLTHIPPDLPHCSTARCVCHRAQLVKQQHSQPHPLTTWLLILCQS